LAINRLITMRTIEHYAERKELFHQGFDELLRQQAWPQIKQHIWDDLKELPRLIPPGREEELHSLRAGIEQFRDYYFDIHAYGIPENMTYWKPTDNALAVSERKLHLMLKESRERQESRRVAAPEANANRKRSAGTEAPRVSNKPKHEKVQQAGCEDFVVPRELAMTKIDMSEEPEPQIKGNV
jgi:hypothetical protein